MPTESQPVHDVVVERNVTARMRDGTALRADVYRPKAPGRYPIILERTPYSKETGGETRTGAPEFYAKRGYAVVIQDTRGRFSSYGDFYPFRDEGWDEHPDGYDTVEWLASQPWSNGKVGTIGGSYSGVTQYRLAPTRPPHLAAMFVRESSADYHDEWVYRGGAFELGFMIAWARGLAYNNLAHFLKGPELEQKRRELEQVEKDIGKWHLRLPLTPNPFVKGFCDWYDEMLEHPDNSPYWSRWDIERRHSDIETPIYHQGAWFDLFLAGTLKNFTGMRRNARAPEARRNQKLVIGPWVHGPEFVGKRVVGEFDFGPEAELDIHAFRLPWFDHWLKGMDNGIEGRKPVRLFIMGVNRWRDEDGWPLPDTRYVPWYLRGGNPASRDARSLNDGTLSAEAPASTEQGDSYDYDPADPVLTHGGSTLNLPGGAFDQREVEARCLTYTSAPLQRAMEVTGPVKVVLHAASSAPDTDWVARLCDVSPDGYSRNLCDGILRARYRESTWQQSLIEPGKVYRYVIDLWATSNVFLPGHRIRVTVTSSNFPRYDRNLNTGGPQNTETRWQVAHNTVFHDESRPSHILLPVIER